MVSLKGPHGSHEFFFVAATGILIWSQWKNSEGVGKSVRSVDPCEKTKNSARSQKFVKFERFVFKNLHQLLFSNLVLGLLQGADS